MTTGVTPRMGRRANRRSIALLAAAAAVTVAVSLTSHSPSGACRTACAGATTWRPSAGFHPLSDAAAAARVRPVAENRPGNSAANHHVPGPAELRAFRRARTGRGQTLSTANPYLAHVTGGFAGTTDEIIQWASWKWGIPADWLRAQYAKESNWNQSAKGDLASEQPAAWVRYPRTSCPTRSRCYESLGITQLKWRADGSQGAGTEPLRWESTAFNVDYQAATVRFYYDDPNGARSAWGDPSYRPGEKWLSIGGWFQPYPWGNGAQRSYVRAVQEILANRAWEQPGF